MKLQRNNTNVNIETLHEWGFFSLVNHQQLKKTKNLIMALLITPNIPDSNSDRMIILLKKLLSEYIGKGFSFDETKVIDAEGIHSLFITIGLEYKKDLKEYKVNPLKWINEKLIAIWNELTNNQIANEDAFEILAECYERVTKSTPYSLAFKFHNEEPSSLFKLINKGKGKAEEEARSKTIN